MQNAELGTHTNPFDVEDIDNNLTDQEEQPHGSFQPTAATLPTAQPLKGKEAATRARGPSSAETSANARAMHQTIKEQLVLYDPAMPAAYERYAFKQAINPKTRTAEFSNLAGAARHAKIKNLPRWMQMQKMVPCFKEFDVVLVYLCGEEGFIAPIDRRHDPRHCYSHSLRWDSPATSSTKNTTWSGASTSPVSNSTACCLR
jgi:hypothetical protein